MTTPSAIVVADSVSPQGKRLTSFGITAHRFILAEINTHRMLSRSYRSSRAVPSKRLIEEVRTAPAMPVHWGANRPGMQAREELSTTRIMKAGTLIEPLRIGLTRNWDASGMTERAVVEELWAIAAENAADLAEEMATRGLHKQIANRVLEPFLWVHGVITATEWDNFFGLRLHEDAQPEFRALAEAMWAAMKASTPRLLEPGEWHLPYVDDADITDMHVYLQDRRTTWTPEDTTKAAILVSVARCARSSYKSFETDKRSTLVEDLEVVRKLNIPGTEFYDPARPIHASPAEHQATPDEIKSYDIEVPVELTDEQKARREMSVSIEFKMKNPSQWGNFVGFRQYRKILPGEAIAPLPLAYQGESK